MSEITVNSLMTQIMESVESLGYKKSYFVVDPNQDFQNIEGDIYTLKISHSNNIENSNKEYQLLTSVTLTFSIDLGEVATEEYLSNYVSWMSTNSINIINAILAINEGIPLNFSGCNDRMYINNRFVLIDFSFNFMTFQCY